MRPTKPNPFGIRTVRPTAWPQYPYNAPPATPERSEPCYEIHHEWNQAIAVLLLDVYRPNKPGEKFPALCAFSPYTRQHQRDAARSRINQPWHPHTRINLLTPGREEELQIEIIPTSNVFQKGHRIRLELANCDSLVQNFFWCKGMLPIPARNTVIQGHRKSRVILPVIPR